jgi:hypothetical protein
MNRIGEIVHRNAHLIVLSVCSALLVVILQFVMTNLFPPAGDNVQVPSLDTAVGEIIPITQEASPKQLVSTLREDELKEFQANGQYEDKQAASSVKPVEVSLDRLFVSLDDQPSYPGVKDAGNTVHIKLPNDQSSDVSICPQDKYFQKSCTMYLVNKSGRSIPVSVGMTDTGDSGVFIMTLRRSADEGEDSSIYTAKPIELTIRTI